MDAWSLPLISACGALGTFRVSVQSHSNTDSWYLYTSPEDLSVRGLPYDAFLFLPFCKAGEDVSTGKLFLQSLQLHRDTVPCLTRMTKKHPAWRKYRRDMLSMARGQYSFKQAMLGTMGRASILLSLPAAAAALGREAQLKIYDSMSERLKNMLDAIEIMLTVLLKLR